jgi:hypothetical protein
MKTCVTCQFSDRQVMTGPHGNMVYDYLCRNENNVDPIEGQPIPCLAARQQPVFCGIEGKHWKAKEEIIKEPSPVILIEGNKNGNSE